MKFRAAKADFHAGLYQVKTNKLTYDIGSFTGKDVDPEVIITRTGSTDPLACKGAKVALKKKSNSLVTTVPRSCLGNPTWVRVGAASLTFDAELNAWVDGARGKGFTNAPGTTTLPLGKKLRRG
jgi:hypothetical protein